MTAVTYKQKPKRWINLISSYHSISTTYDKQELVPEMLYNYRKHYKYVDFMDSDLGHVLPPHCTSSWKLAVFRWLLLLIAHNAKVLYNEIHKDRISLVEFIRFVSNTFQKRDAHLLVTVNFPGYCSRCRLSGFKRKVYTYCNQCNKFYHEKCYLQENINHTK